MMDRWRWEKRKYLNRATGPSEGKLEQTPYGSERSGGAGEGTYRHPPAPTYVAANSSRAREIDGSGHRESSQCSKRRNRRLRRRQRKLSVYSDVDINKGQSGKANTTRKSKEISEHMVKLLKQRRTSPELVRGKLTSRITSRR
jgi:hypothetical protein